ncbi:Transcriptional regulator AcuR [Aquimixticola soesokkakensis]|uniref:Transcriptional regulator AcuR n=2 Tax=Aquimixticola soesokkakensis TaxID=1519096 RepID=A0A1Y5TLP7_9RHOB|nr:Transcriptional regulator AcuR [Aquimixticola soesokkakensis]
MTQTGFASLRLEDILVQAKVPKGSFYYHFPSKAAFTSTLITAYQDYLSAKLARHFTNPALPPLARLRAFTQEAQTSMARFEFRRGCLVGNLGQEVVTLPSGMRAQLQAALAQWQTQTAGLLRAAIGAGDLPADTDPDALAAYFWIGWEGAVLRAKLDQSPRPLIQFRDMFFNSLKGT